MDLVCDMNISNLIIILIVAALVLLVSVYLLRAKKSGVKCIGCPDGKSCSGSCAANGEGCSGCPGSCSSVGHYYSE